MRRNVIVRIGLGSVLAGLLLALSTNTFAVAILTGPVFTPATNAPLAGALTLATDVPSRVSVSVNDGTTLWEKDFYDFGTTHTEPLLGFKPNRTNQISVTVYDASLNSLTASNTLTFITSPLPIGFPTSTVLVDNPAQMEPGYILFIIANETTDQGFITIVDNSGQVVWYSPNSLAALDARQLANGDLFMAAGAGFNFVEMNLLGETVQTVPVPAWLPINFHDAVPTGHGTILYLTDASQIETNFPSSVRSDSPLQDIAVDYNSVVEVSATNGALLNTWSLIDMLDPYRLTYLTFTLSTDLGLDIQHANAVLEDTNDNNAIIVSLREQNAVVKFSRDGELKWILGPPEGWPFSFQQYLLTPVGSPFQWNYGQHAPTLTPQGTLLLYNNGVDRAMPPDPLVPDQDNYSDAVEYKLNETNMEVSQVWNSGQTNDDCLFTPIIGNPQWLPQTGHVLTTYGYVTYLNGSPPDPKATNATMVRIKELTHDPVPKVVFDLSFFDYGDVSPGYLGYFCYRSRRIPDLYGHPHVPVANLTVSYAGGVSQLEFSADPTLAYSVQSSTDLVKWQTLGVVLPVDQAGNFQFSDSSPNRVACFYRVLTQP